MDELVKAMGMEEISKSQVSRLCGEIDGRVQTFLRRPIGDWLYLWLDATYVKARRDHHGRREVLGMTIGNSEAEPFWTEFLRSLTGRGLRGVKRSSRRPWGLKAAITKVLEATWQGAACTSCATPCPMPARHSVASSPPGSAPPSPRMMPTPLRRGARWPISCGRVSPSSQR